MADQFFTFDSQQKCLRPLLGIDHPIFPRLAKKMLSDIQNKIIDPTPQTWHTIVEKADSPGIVDDSILVSSCLSSIEWRSFQSKDYRTKHINQQWPAHSTILNPQSWHTFWTIPIAPEARSLWYRLIRGKVHCQQSIFDIQVSQ